MSLSMSECGLAFCGKDRGIEKPPSLFREYDEWLCHSPSSYLSYRWYSQRYWYSHVVGVVIFIKPYHSPKKMATLWPWQGRYGPSPWQVKNAKDIGLSIGDSLRWIDPGAVEKGWFREICTDVGYTHISIYIYTCSRVLSLDMFRSLQML